MGKTYVELKIQVDKLITKISSWLILNNKYTKEYFLMYDTESHLILFIINCVYSPELADKISEFDLEIARSKEFSLLTLDIIEGPFDKDFVMRGGAMVSSPVS